MRVKRSIVVGLSGVIGIGIALLLTAVLWPKPRPTTPEGWVALAEECSTSKRDYTADLTTTVYENSSLGNLTTQSAIEHAQLRYTKKEGLKLKPGGGQFAFYVDIATMLKQLRGKAQWKLEETEQAIDGNKCVVVSAGGDRWQVRLWISHDDGAVLRYDQYLDSKCVAICHLEYGDKHQSVMLPRRIVTEFPVTHQVMDQTYASYTLSKGE